MFAVSPSGLIETRGARSLQNIEYGKARGVSLLLDAFLPQSDKPTAAVIIVHGGGWVRGDRRTDVQPQLAPIEKARIARFSIDYRLATNITQFGVAIDDVKAAIRFVKSRARDYNIDLDRLTILGESAGAQLAAMAILSGERDLRVCGFVGIYTPSDLVALMREAHYIPSEMRRSIIGTPWEKLVLSQIAKLSPLQNVAAGMPPTLLIHGTNDPLVPYNQSVAFCERIRQTGGQCELYPVSGAGHGIRWWNDVAYKTKLAEWLRSH